MSPRASVRRWTRLSLERQIFAATAVMRVPVLVIGVAGSVLFSLTALTAVVGATSPVVVAQPAGTFREVVLLEAPGGLGHRGDEIDAGVDRQDGRVDDEVVQRRVGRVGVVEPPHVAGA